MTKFLVFLRLLCHFLTDITVCDSYITENNNSLERFKSEQEKMIDDAPDDKRSIVAERVFGNWYARALRKERELKEAVKFQIRITPRMLIDDIEDKYSNDFATEMSNMQHKYDVAKKNLRDIHKSCRSIQNKLINNLQLTPDERTTLKKNESAMNRQGRKLSKELKERAYYLRQFPDMKKEENIERRIRKWNWLFQNRKSDERITAIRQRIKKEYNEKPEKFRKSRSLKQFIHDFFHALAVAHELGSSAVHASKKIECATEFERINFFGVESLDSHLTLFVNAIGLRKPMPENIYVIRTNAATGNEG